MQLLPLKRCPLSLPCFPPFPPDSSGFCCYFMDPRINPIVRGELLCAKKWECVNTHTHTVQDAKSVSCVSLSVWATLLLGTMHHSAPPARTCVRVCVCVDRGTGGCWEHGRNTTGSRPLAARGEGERGRKGGTEGVDEVSKDSCIAELYLLQSTIWTVSALHFTESPQVKQLHSRQNKMDVDWLSSFSVCLMDFVESTCICKPAKNKCSVSLATLTVTVWV